MSLEKVGTKKKKKTGIFGEDCLHLIYLLQTQCIIPHTAENTFSFSRINIQGFFHFRSQPLLFSATHVFLHQSSSNVNDFHTFLLRSTTYCKILKFCIMCSIKRTKIYSYNFHVNATTSTVVIRNT